MHPDTGFPIVRLMTRQHPRSDRPTVPQRFPDEPAVGDRHATLPPPPKWLVIAGDAPGDQDDVEVM